MKTKFIFTLLILCTSLLGFSQDYYVHCGKILDVQSGKESSNQTIVVSKTKIIKILDGFVTKTNPEDVEVDLKTKYILPGLIDLHVHVEGLLNSHSYVSKYIDNEADIAFEAAHYAEITLLAGFTTVRDLGGTGVNISLRNAINKGIVKGPRIFTAGKAIASSGGHADPTNGSNRKLVEIPVLMKVS